MRLHLFIAAPRGPARGGVLSFSGRLALDTPAGRDDALGNVALGRPAALQAAADLVG